MNTLPRVTKGHHWRPLNALRCPSTRLLTPSSTVFQPIFPPVAYAIRVNGCNHPYPTAYCFLLYSSRSWRRGRRDILRYSNNKRTVKICNQPSTPVSLGATYFYLFIRRWWKVGNGEERIKREKKRGGFHRKIDLGRLWGQIRPETPPSIVSPPRN